MNSSATDLPKEVEGREVTESPRESLLSIASNLGISPAQADQLFDSLVAKGVRISPAALAEREVAKAEHLEAGLETAGIRNAAVLETAGIRDADILRTAGAREAEVLKTAGQRRINFLWELTQAIVATIVVLGTMITSALIVNRGGSDSSTAFLVMSNGFFIIIAMYFQRTNHTKTGGISGKDER